MSIFSERLREVLRTNQMSQSDLAKKIGMSHDAINSYCTEKRKPPIDVLILICKAGRKRRLFAWISGLKIGNVNYEHIF